MVIDISSNDKEKILDNPLYDLAGLAKYCREDFYFFSRYMYTHWRGSKFLRNWHHEVICDHLTNVSKGNITKLIINMPPSHSKSLFVSVLFPAWCFLNNMGCRFINISYSEEVSVVQNSSYCRAIVGSEAFRRLLPFDFYRDDDDNNSNTISIDSNSSIFKTGNNVSGKRSNGTSRDIIDSRAYWETINGGFYYGTTSFSAITGKHAGSKDEIRSINVEKERVITDEDTGRIVKIEKYTKEDYVLDRYFGGLTIDDPLKPKDAHSEVMRDTVNRNYENTISSRKNTNLTSEVVVMQRLHENDLTGHLLKTYPGEWELLKISALDERTGKALWPIVKTDRQLRLLQKEDPATFYAQYQQDPVSEVGNLIDISKFNRYEILPKSNDIEFSVVTVDTASTIGASSDYTVLQHWGRVGTRAYLLNVFRDKVLEMDIPDLALNKLLTWRPNVVHIELAGGGISVYQSLKSRSIIPIIGCKPVTGKRSRLSDVIHHIGGGNVYIPDENLSGNEWVKLFLYECKAFPRGNHDDQVDAMTLALSVLFSNSAGKLIYPGFCESNISEDDTLSVIPKIPLIVSFNTIGYPAAIIAQVYKGQLRIYDCLVSNNRNSKEFMSDVDELLFNSNRYNKVFSNNRSFSSSSSTVHDVRVFVNKGNKSNVNFLDFENNIAKFFKCNIISSKIDRITREIIEEASRLFETYSLREFAGNSLERKIVIDRRCTHLINAFNGGIRFEDESSQRIRPRLRIVDDYPYSPLGNAFHQMVYQIFLSKMLNANYDSNDYGNTNRLRLV